MFRLLGDCEHHSTNLQRGRFAREEDDVLMAERPKAAEFVPLFHVGNPSSQSDLLHSLAQSDCNQLPTEQVRDEDDVNQVRGLWAEKRRPC
jgi:hypothetical protein